MFVVLIGFLVLGFVYGIGDGTSWKMQLKKRERSVFLTSRKL